ncbi:hypothetical protein BDN70DRAFT_798899 [Pholiota conissans]|uniref:Methyltransferase-domain-containing protein n=1 Tax=Pholiota conissans TaxID=109636 RepID=A0A9P5ZCD9_9AGAR|nr:hypothetical protein BDN70DRAFT_798899 [Pholiota conissans]
MTSSQPAHRTKHIPLLPCLFNNARFSLVQRADGVSNGTALWLGGQCLALFLAQAHLKFARSALHPRPRAIELGSGIGLTALALCSLGWDVLATDIPHVISSVLAKNISHNLSALPLDSGIVQIRELDWSVPPEKWMWDHDHVIASHSEPPFDIIISADTVYSLDLIEPMLRTLHALSTLSLSASRYPPILLCIERRDPALVDRLLTDAKELWSFSVERIPHKKLAKAVEKGSQWDKSDWEGVELWKFKLNPK